ncbi:helix-turn-helix transcriptional regulator [Escherichia albertii]
MIGSVLRSESMFWIKNIKIYQPAFIFTKNAEITFIRDSESVTLPPYTIAFLEKGLDFSMRVLRKGDGIPYKSLIVDNTLLAPVYYLFEQTTYNGMKIPIPSNRVLQRRLFIIDDTEHDENLLEFMENNRNDNTLLSSRLAIALSKVPDRDGLFISMGISLARNFCDKIREIVEDKLERKWKVSDLAEIFYCSEISIRKKLEKENTSFYQLMHDIRMKKAAKLILNTDCNVTKVASTLGISSTSYFIKQFKNFYGMTPKKYYLNLRQ